MVLLLVGRSCGSDCRGRVRTGAAAGIAIMGAVWLLVAFDMHHCHEALMSVEWDTLLFFAALFVVVEGVSEMGLLR